MSLARETADHGEQSVVFDHYAINYDAALNRALASTGEQRDFYASRRIRWSASCASELGVDARNILDFGCGDGSSAALLLQQFKATRLIGVDESKESIRQACRSDHPENTKFLPLSDFQPSGEMDLAYCNGVFHHIAPIERSHWLEYVRASLQPGGLFVFWENNPWNPGTRYVMSRCDFDKDAILLSISEASKLLSKAGFEILRWDSLFYFPRQLRFARRLEPFLTRLPFGGQYQVLCRKPYGSA